MAKDYAKKFYKSKAWKQCKDGYLKTQDYICERCGGPAKVVHHKRYIDIKTINDPSITLAWDNLETLCQDCHTNEHLANSNVREDVRFSAKGELIFVGPPLDSYY